ncbi:MAG TPA: ferritin family protein [Burkholderiaceae bacterium]|nr:ferritin family protein [Burkholderiaceae bacterium]
MSGPRTIDEFMAQALAMERDAVQRYEELADAMEMANNRDVAKAFRTMAGYEAKHAQAIMDQMKWTVDPPVPARAWPSAEAPEVVPNDEVHYLMQPWHALELALAAEQRAEAFFDELARTATDDAVRRAAIELRDEETEHVAMVRKWMARYPKPDADWADDPDPPRYTE